MKLICSVAGCGSKDRTASTIWRGFALCEECWEMALELPDSLPNHAIDAVLSRLYESDVPDGLYLTDAVKWVIAEREVTPV